MADPMMLVSDPESSVLPQSVPQGANPRKRPRLEEDTTPELVLLPQIEPADLANIQQESVDGDVTVQLLDSLHVPAALKIIRALQRADRHLRAIGVCPTKHAAQTKMMLSYGPAADDQYHKVRFDDEEDYDYGRKTAEQEKANAARIKRNQELFGKLESVADANSRNHACGYLDKPFNLRISRPGCEFDGPITPSRTNLKSFRLKGLQDMDTRDAVHKRLKGWYKKAVASGYGDVREQVTKTDKSVRTAREINTSEFAVEDELLRRVEDIWKEQFVPGCDVRAEPYKIHLYGPGGHFKEHRDTPQKDLMGTFLVGLGDTADSGSLVIDGKDMEARPGSWCAFYPDVLHSVTKVSGGYRGVIAFKIFRTSSATGSGDGETQKAAEVRRRVEEIVSHMEAPYGVLLEHKYCLGTDEFSGFDRLLVNTVRALSADKFDVHHLPVAVSARSMWGSESTADRYEDYAICCVTRVYPFTSGHIEFLNTGVDEESGSTVDHKACGCAWLDGVTDVQFYAVDLSQRTMFPFKHEQHETCNHVGNEAQAWREDSVYLSYALVVLPKTTAKENGEEEEKVGEGSEDDEESEFEQGGEEAWDSEGSDYEVDGEEEEDSEEDESGEEEGEE
ncbi:uncharacterized protein TRAVEDRAFT_20565 [Trametes versicolor FP-101664 SS1]|uniref:uncharacterized protein n=1 Tax=Trametes versicolor (strain FP-101664) TaxID=717944 RepID=UPI0004623CCF|nr:uncharacterized protein TRAVEDRAFT_20565 [Trametes versicolor FP-101664 SS1]EIW58615.1 hypothetical protein TRAVEDRAFT_20565 [Trametes versicolor FP-101664 SS1]